MLALFASSLLILMARANALHSNDLVIKRTNHAATPNCRKRCRHHVQMWCHNIGALIPTTYTKDASASLSLSSSSSFPFRTLSLRLLDDRTMHVRNFDPQKHRNDVAQRVSILQPSRQFMIHYALHTDYHINNTCVKLYLRGAALCSVCCVGGMCVAAFKRTRRICAKPRGPHSAYTIHEPSSTRTKRTHNMEFMTKL